MITLILAAVMILSAAYSAFFQQTEDEIETEANMLAGFINSSESPELAYELFENYEKERSIGIYSDFAVIYKNSIEFKNSSKTVETAVFLARKEGIGKAERYSPFGMTDFFSYAVKLEDGNILSLSGEAVKFTDMFSGILIAIIFIVFI